MQNWLKSIEADVMLKGCTQTMHIATTDSLQAPLMDEAVMST